MSDDFFAEYFVESALEENPKERKLDDQPHKKQMDPGGRTNAKPVKKLTNELGEPSSDSFSNADGEEDEFCHQDDDTVNNFFKI